MVFIWSLKFVFILIDEALDIQLFFKEKIIN